MRGGNALQSKNVVPSGHWHITVSHLRVSAALPASAAAAALLLVAAVTPVAQEEYKSNE